MKEIDLTQLLKLMLKHIIPIIISGLVCAAIVFGYCVFFATPTYRTTTSILVNNGGLSEVGPSSDSVSGSDISASLYLVTTCVDIIESDNMYKDLAKALDNKYSYYYLKNCFSASPRSEESLLIDIVTCGSDPEEIKEIANTFLEIAPTFICNNILNVDIKVLATAEKAIKTGPRTLFNTVIALFLGAACCFFICIVIYLSKNTIESERDFKARYEVPLLGSIPVFEIKQSGGKHRGKSK